MRNNLSCRAFLRRFFPSVDENLLSPCFDPPWLLYRTNRRETIDPCPLFMTNRNTPRGIYDMSSLLVPATGISPLITSLPVAEIIVYIPGRAFSIMMQSLPFLLHTAIVVVALLIFVP